MYINLYIYIYNKYNTKPPWKFMKTKQTVPLDAMFWLSESFQRRSPENEISLKLWVNQITRLSKAGFLDNQIHENLRSPKGIEFLGYLNWSLWYCTLFQAVLGGGDSRIQRPYPYCLHSHFRYLNMLVIRGPTPPVPPLPRIIVPFLLVRP